jgi:hypothetical protein
MITAAGARCSRTVGDGLAGFCWQHAPKSARLVSTWKERIEAAALAISVAEIVIKIAELAVAHLPEAFGPGDDALDARSEIEDDLSLGGGLSDGRMDSYSSGARVDWPELRDIYFLAKEVRDSPSKFSTTAVREVESRVEKWIDRMNPYHHQLLLKSIERVSSAQ